jgi:hypothetical protein
MGRSWGIVTESDEQSAARWQPLMIKASCERIALPIGNAGHYLALKFVAGEFTSQRFFNNDMISEIRSLDTSDMTWDEVEVVLSGQMVFLPMIRISPFLYTGPGFEPRTIVGGLDRLLSLKFSSVLDIQLQTAARLATYNRFAIQVHP